MKKENREGAVEREKEGGEGTGKRKKSRKGKLWELVFLAVIALAYAWLALTDYALFLNAWNAFGRMILQIAPAMVLVLVIMFLVNLFFEQKKFTEHITKMQGIKLWVYSIVLGILSVGPIYVWHPLLIEFKEKGLKNEFLAVFLYNRAVKVPLLPVMVCYFGLVFTVVFTFYMIVFSVVSGIIVGKIVKG